jgi:hypothetical protein
MQEGTYTQAFGRCQFLEAVKTVNPEVSEALRDQVLPNFSQAVNNIPDGVPHAVRAALGQMRRSLARIRTTLTKCDDMLQRELYSWLPSLSPEERFSALQGLIDYCKDSLYDNIRDDGDVFLNPEAEATRGETLPFGRDPAADNIAVNWAEIESDPELADVRAAIFEWARKYNLGDEWILDIVVQTLLSWEVNPHDRERLRWAHFSYSCPMPIGLRFQVDLPWRFEPWNRFERRVKDRLKGFQHDVLAHCFTIGYDPEKTPPYKWFEWLALFQTKQQPCVAGRKPRFYSPAAIRKTIKKKSEKRTEPAILMAIHSAADHIGLTLRQGLRGKSRKRQLPPTTI